MHAQMTNNQTDLSGNVGISTAETVATEDEWTTVARGPRRKKQNQHSLSENKNRPRFQYKQNTPSASKKRHASSKPSWQFIRNKIVAAKTRLATSQWWLQTRVSLLHAVGTNTIQFVQCLGLGSFERSDSSRHQFACAMLIRELFDDVLCTISDPVLSLADRQIAESLGFDVVPSQPVDRTNIHSGCGVLFMPHCEEDLNNAMLARWIIHPNVSDIVLLGNTLSLYIRDDVSGSLIATLADSGRLVERLCPNPKLSTYESAFNNLCITTVFPE